MKSIRISLLAGLAVALCLGAKARLYNLKTGEVLEAKFSRGMFHNSHGTISVKYTDGTLLIGEYSTVPRGNVAWGSIYAGVIGPRGGASTTGSGIAYSGSAGVPGSAIMTGSGHVIQCEFISNVMSGHGSGGCQSNDGTLFKLMY
jgi:hypothetical protein